MGAVRHKWQQGCESGEGAGFVIVNTLNVLQTNTTCKLIQPLCHRFEVLSDAWGRFLVNMTKDSYRFTCFTQTSFVDQLLLTFVKTETQRWLNMYMSVCAVCGLRMNKTIT